MILCFYGCGQEAKYQFKNNKWCCSQNKSSCPEIIKKTCHKGKDNPMFGRKNPTRSEMNRKNSGEKSPVFGKKNPGVSEMLRQRVGDKHPLFGKPGYWTGKKRENLSGVNHPNWNGGSSFTPYSPEWNENLRKQIRERDSYTCQLCGEYGKHVHHIDYNKKHCYPSNLITLCKSDNGKVNKNRDLWEIYFRLYMLVKGVTNEC